MRLRTHVVGNYCPRKNARGGRHGEGGGGGDDGARRGGAGAGRGAARGGRAELHLRVHEAVHADGDPEHAPVRGQVPGECLYQELRGGLHAQGLPQAAQRGHFGLRDGAAHPRRGAHAAVNDRSMHDWHSTCSYVVVDRLCPWCDVTGAYCLRFSPAVFCCAPIVHEFPAVFFVTCMRYICTCPCQCICMVL